MQSRSDWVPTYVEASRIHGPTPWHHPLLVQASHLLAALSHWKYSCSAPLGPETLVNASMILPLAWRVSGFWRITPKKSWRKLRMDAPHYWTVNDERLPAWICHGLYARTASALRVPASSPVGQIDKEQAEPFKARSTSVGDGLWYIESLCGSHELTWLSFCSKRFSDSSVMLNTDPMLYSMGLVLPRRSGRIWIWGFPCQYYAIWDWRSETGVRMPKTRKSTALKNGIHVAFDNELKYLCGYVNNATPSREATAVQALERFYVSLHTIYMLIEFPTSNSEIFVCKPHAITWTLVMGELIRGASLCIRSLERRDQFRWKQWRRWTTYGGAKRWAQWVSNGISKVTDINKQLVPSA